MFPKRSRHLGLPQVGGHVERGASIRTGLDPCAMREEQHGDFRPAISDRGKERSGEVIVILTCRICVRSGVEQGA